MNQNEKLIFIDLDGTTLDKKINGKWTLSNKNKKAIVSAREKGIEIVVSTGRTGNSADRFIEEIGGNYFIQGNGSLIKDINNKIIFEKKIELRSFIQILDLAQKNKLILKNSLNNKLYGVVGKIQRCISKKLGMDFTSGYTLSINIPMHKISLLGSICKSKIQKIVNEINKNIDGVIAVTSAKGYVIEITSNEATKGKASELIIKKLKINKNKTMHIGNTMNDSTTKKIVGKLIAMKNADRSLKKIADYIGPHYKNGGVAKILNNEYELKKYKEILFF